MKSEKSMEIIKPNAQLNLFGYENYFKFFDKLYEKNRLPNSMLLSGPKGLGKSTFIYHFINYLLSKDEKYNYDKEKFSIDENNFTYKLIQNGTHPNLFLLDANNNEENIKIEQARRLLLFLNKSTYYKGLKIVLLDNAEYLNVSSSNALLKAIEEPSENTFFFIINNNSQRILNTIKSRCIDFKFYLNFSEKKNIFYRISRSYDFSFTETDLNNFLSFDSHGNLLNYLAILNSSGFNISKNYLSCISHLLDLYTAKTDSKILGFISLFVQYFYNQLSLENNSFVNSYQKKLDKILYLINDMKKFHLDKKNLIFTINKIIKNER